MNRRKHAMATHEATHAVVARNLGLPVLWVSIIAGYDEDEGLAFPAACKIRSEAEQDQRLVLAAMAAPSCVPTNDAAVNQYADFEAWLAYERADRSGLDRLVIRLDAEREARKGLSEIEDLATQLVAEGRVEFAEQVVA